MASPAPLRIGTRASALARTQAGWVAGRLQALGLETTIETISTSGDHHADVPIAAIGRDGVFVRELERALLEDRIDVAVHSLKDMPTAETAGLTIASVPPRATAFDALVSAPGTTLATLPPGAIVGTSSVRRIAQVRHGRPDLVAVPVRGNVDTRLRKLEAGECHALVLAAAGLERLGLAGLITELLRPPTFWPAVAQGALGVQVRDDDARSRDAVVLLDDAETHAAVVAERACLAALAGGCLAPIGGWARREGGALVLGACVLDDDPSGVRRLMAEARTETAGDDAKVSMLDACRSLGVAVAADLGAQGAGTMLEKARTAKIPERPFRM